MRRFHTVFTHSGQPWHSSRRKATPWKHESWRGKRSWENYFHAGWKSDKLLFSWSLILFALLFIQTALILHCSALFTCSIFLHLPIDSFTLQVPSPKRLTVLHLKNFWWFDRSNANWNVLVVSARSLLASFAHLLEDEVWEVNLTQDSFS